MTPTPAPAGLPPYPLNVSHVTRRIRACEGETAAQVVLEYALREYALAAIAAQPAIPPSNAELHKLWLEITDGDSFGWGSAKEFVRRIFASAPQPQNQGSSDHLVPCDGGGVPADEAAEFVKQVLDDCGYHVWSDDGNTVIGIRPPRETTRHHADFMKAADWLVKYGYADWDASAQPEHLHIHAKRRPDAPTGQIKELSSNGGREGVCR